MAKKDEAEAKGQKQGQPEDKPENRADKKPENRAENRADKKATTQDSSGFDIVNFLKGTREELDKVVWPSRQQLVSESFAVILMVTLSATVIYLFDQLFTLVARRVFG